jgi:hypothetical protein
MTAPEVAEETGGQLERYYSEVNNVPVIPDNFYTDYPASAEVGDAKVVSGSRADPIRPVSRSIGKSGRLSDSTSSLRGCFTDTT